MKKIGAMPRQADNLPFASSGRNRQRGSYVMEFVLVLMVLLPVSLTAGEIGRVSLCDQILARATHRAALAAGRNAADCERRARDAFERDTVARWLFDADDDGRIGFVTGSGPDTGAGEEVRLDISADDGDVANGVAFNQPLCGVSGSWIRVQASVPIRSQFGLGVIVLRQASWSLNQSVRA